MTRPHLSPRARSLRHWCRQRGGHGQHLAAAGVRRGHDDHGDGHRQGAGARRGRDEDDQGPAHTSLDLGSPELHRLVVELSLETKVQRLTGQDFWTTSPVESIGLRRMVLSDGPSGVRGEVWDERFPSLNLPSATALSSSWARSWPTATVPCSPWRPAIRASTWSSTRGVQRAADLAAAFVRGLQGHGVAAEVSQRALRELYAVLSFPRRSSGCPVCPEL